jgi:hypothetical protein
LWIGVAACRVAAEPSVPAFSNYRGLGDGAVAFDIFGADIFLSCPAVTGATTAVMAERPDRARAVIKWSASTGAIVLSWSPR